MDGHESLLDKLSHFVHKHFLWLMIGSYAVAACAPSLGLAIRDVSVGRVALFGQTMRVSLSMLMLASLLLNAGLGVQWDQIREMLRSPNLLGAGLAANLLIPIAFILGVTRLMAGWHNADEVQNILVGLALVASMPIAGSSTAWAQNADGELTLSLGLVLFSTLLSPLTTPIALHSVGLMATGDYAEDLHELAAGGTGMFLAFCVLAPSLIGIGVRRGCRRCPVHRREAAPQTHQLRHPAGPELFQRLHLAAPGRGRPRPGFPRRDAGYRRRSCACSPSRPAGRSRGCSKATPAQRTSLMFGLGMNNNGTGLVLASMALADHPRVMLPIIFYNLVQHLIAGIVDRLSGSTPTPPTAATESSPREGAYDRRSHPLEFLGTRAAQVR